MRRRQRQEREQEIRLLQGLDDFCTSVQEALVDPSFDIKRKVLQLVVDRIIVEGTRLVVRHIVPAGPVRLQTEHFQSKTPYLKLWQWPRHIDPYSDRALRLIALEIKC
jgi:hypothetical protein